MSLEVEVVTNKEQLWFGQAKYVSVMTGGGSVGILPGRQPLLATVVESTVHIQTLDDEKVQIPVGSGILSLDSDIVNIVVEDISYRNKA